MQADAIYRTLDTIECCDEMRTANTIYSPSIHYPTSYLCQECMTDCSSLACAVFGYTDVCCSL